MGYYFLLSAQQKNNSKMTMTQPGKEDKVIEAATDVFLRYGYARTTMRDVAERAGISRPALYLVFPRKDDIFAAVLRHLSETALEEYRRALPQFPSLEEKLHFCCEKWGAHGFDLAEVHPDSKDLFDPSFAPVREMYADFAAFLAELLTEAVAASALQSTPEELAYALVSAMRGFEEFAEDGAHMRRMIALQVNVVCAAVRKEK